VATESCTIRTRRRLDAGLGGQRSGQHRRELGVDPHPHGRGREIVIAPVVRARRTHSAAYGYARWGEFITESFRAGHPVGVPR
jgi:hypothetical protein